MKNDSTEARNLKALLEKLDAKHHPDDPPASDPVTQLVIGFLQWETTRKQAESAFAKLMHHLVDINELRVTYDRELIDILGRNYPRGEERVARMREALNEIYVREHAVAMHSIAEKSKKEQRSYLDSLPGVPPYAVAQVMLLSFGGHAMPVDEKLVAALADQQILVPGTRPADAENELLRQVKASEALHVHMLLQAWVDEGKSSGKGRAGKKQAASQKSAKRSAKTTSQSKRSSTKSSSSRTAGSSKSGTSRSRSTRK